jgi:hypothetical protein
VKGKKPRQDVAVTVESVTPVLANLLTLNRTNQEAQGNHQGKSEVETE